MKNEEPESHKKDDTFTVGEGQVNVGAKSCLVVNPGDDHSITQEAEQEDAGVKAHAFWQR